MSVVSVMRMVSSARIWASWIERRAICVVAGGAVGGVSRDQDVNYIGVFAVNDIGVPGDRNMN